jgi:serine phosphatase RsbU (regulator of sigma subunit)
MRPETVQRDKSVVKRLAERVVGAWRWISADVPSRGFGSVLGASALLTLALAISHHSLRRNPGAIYLFLFVVLWAAIRWGFFHAVFATALTLVSESIWTAPTWADIRLNTPEDLRLAVFVFTSLGISALLAGVRRQEKTLRIDYETQRAVAVVVQKALLPHASRIPGYDVAFAYRPSSRESNVGGDFLDVFDLGGGKFGILLGDVTGHGVEASVQTAEIRYGIRALAFQGLSPSECIRTINDLLGRTAERERFATAFLGIIDSTSHQLCFANAGQDAGLLWRSSDSRIEKLGNTGAMLGVAPSASIEFTEKSVGIGPGDGLVLHSDGVTEARGQAGFFGSERLEKLVLREKATSATTAVEILYRAVEDFSDGDLRDDVAVLWIRRHSNRRPRGPGSEPGHIKGPSRAKSAYR